MSNPPRPPYTALEALLTLPWKHSLLPSESNLVLCETHNSDRGCITWTVSGFSETMWTLTVTIGECASPRPECKCTRHELNRVCEHLWHSYNEHTWCCLCCCLCCCCQKTELTTNNIEPVHCADEHTAYTLPRAPTLGQHSVCDECFNKDCKVPRIDESAGLWSHCPILQINRSYIIRCGEQWKRPR